MCKTSPLQMEQLQKLPDQSQGTLISYAQDALLYRRTVVLGCYAPILSITLSLSLAVAGQFLANHGRDGEVFFNPLVRIIYPCVLYLFSVVFFTIAGYYICSNKPWYLPNIQERIDGARELFEKLYNLDISVLPPENIYTELTSLRRRIRSE